MSSNATAFNQRIEARKKSVRDLVANRHAQLAEYAHRTAEEISPVDTGDFRRAWKTVTDDRDLSGWLWNVRSGDAARAGEEIPPIGAFTLSRLVNRDPAGPQIERGSSDQAPQGVLSIVAIRTKEYAESLR